MGCGSGSRFDDEFVSTLPDTSLSSIIPPPPVVRGYRYDWSNRGFDSSLRSKFVSFILSKCFIGRINKNRSTLTLESLIRINVTGYMIQYPLFSSRMLESIRIPLFSSSPLIQILFFRSSERNIRHSTTRDHDLARLLSFLFFFSIRRNTRQAESRGGTTLEPTSHVNIMS